jgi:5-formyltetrahydrofolate cyclo-ligase
MSCSGILAPRSVESSGDVVKLRAMVDPVQPADPKKALRREMRERRDAVTARERVRAAITIAARPAPVPIGPGIVVSGFSPIKNEIDPIPLMRRLSDVGARLALPIVVARGKPLVMRSWAFGEPLRTTGWGIREPEMAAAALEPDIVIVPLLAFDRRGHRIGYGAGYYDITLTALRERKVVVAIGIAFAIQEIDAVPDEPGDARLDFVLTEKETIVTNPDIVERTRY